MNQQTVSGQHTKNKPITDQELKRLLAKMLPEIVISATPIISWRRAGLPRVLDTELLHLCWLIESQLNSAEHTHFRQRLKTTFDLNPELHSIERHSISATWQQRVIALAKVKGVEI